MENLKINNSLFYGIKNNYNESSIEILESILSHGFILNHNGLGNTLNGNAVSLCFHPANEKLYEELKNSRNTSSCNQDAFSTFINNNNPSIVLSSTLLDELKDKNVGIYKSMRDEIHVLEDIPLKYMIAIGYGDSTTTHIQNLRMLLGKHEKDSQFYHDFTEYYYNVYIRNLLIIHQNNIKLIKLLLEKHNYQVPIIDPLTGKEYGSYKEENYKLKKELNLIK